MHSQAELDRFYEGLVREVRARSGVCAITSGMACVHYAVAHSTKDCDALCAVDSLPIMLEVIGQTNFGGAKGGYRGHLTPPLDRRWLAGGWTSHFAWESEGARPHLDVFGVAPRASFDWTTGVRGLYASRQTVAEMKRTDRPKDWPFSDALGAQLIESGNLDGWLHIFDAETLRRLHETVPLPDSILARRPSLELLRNGDDRLKLAVFAERQFWQELDHHRIKLHEQFIRQYMIAVKRDTDATNPELLVQHAVRVEHAERLLPFCPILDYGIDRLIEDAKRSTRELLSEDALQWLPGAGDHFFGLRSDPSWE